jgi:protein SMG6
MELEPERDRWQRVAREWYAKIVAEFPGHGKLRHHLELLRREVEGNKPTSLRGKAVRFKSANLLTIFRSFSMIATHPFEIACEPVLPLWSAAQA